MCLAYMYTHTNILTQKYLSLFHYKLYEDEKYVLYQSEQARLSAETKDPGLLLMAGAALMAKPSAVTKGG